MIDWHRLNFRSEAEAKVFVASHELDLSNERDVARSEGIKARVISMHTVKPLDREAIIAAAGETGGIVTVEEHNIYGGLGSAVAEVLAEAGTGTPFKRIALPDTHVHEVGTHGWLLNQYGFSPESIAATVHELIAQDG